MNTAQHQRRAGGQDRRGSGERGQILILKVEAIGFVV